MASSPTPATHRVCFAISDEQAARRVVDVLTEVFFEGEAAVAAFERPDLRWDVTVHFADPPDQALVRELVTNAAGAEVARGIAFDIVEAKDWVKASLDDLVPVPAGRFVVHGQHDRARIAPNKLGIEIEAALAFGTGHHGTTRGCLVALDDICRSGTPRRILDVGTGTGVLAIAAALTLRRGVIATDIDVPSVQVARGNARLNRAAGITFMHANGVMAPAIHARAPFDLVFANILLGPLKRLAAPIRGILAPGGRIVLSGILNAQANAALAAYRPLMLERRTTLDGWTTLVLRRGLRSPDIAHRRTHP